MNEFNMHQLRRVRLSSFRSKFLLLSILLLALGVIGSACAHREKDDRYKLTEVIARPWKKVSNPSATATAPASQPAVTEYECRFTDNPITIDGNAAEADWNNAVVVDHFSLP